MYWAMLEDFCLCWPEKHQYSLLKTMHTNQCCGWSQCHILIEYSNTVSKCLCPTTPLPCQHLEMRVPSSSFTSINSILITFLLGFYILQRKPVKLEWINNYNYIYIYLYSLRYFSSNQPWFKWHPLDTSKMEDDTFVEPNKTSWDFPVC